MELKDFIKTALTDITDVIKELQDGLQNGAIVSPSMPHAIANKTIVDPENTHINRPISKIDFDVAITVGNADKVGGNGKIGIHILSAKIDNENVAHSENVSRMTFSIPIVLPTYHVKSKIEIAEETK